MTREYHLSKENLEKVRERCRLLGLSRKGKKLSLSSEQRAKLSTTASVRFSDKGNPNWKGDSVGYRSLHNWVENHLGKPQSCSKCGANKLRPRQYHWANVSGVYNRVQSDWIRLCVKCHVAFDKCRRSY